jgi:hypothetical protein
MKFLAAGVLDIVIITFLTDCRRVEISYTKHKRNATTGRILELISYCADNTLSFGPVCYIF